MNYALSQQTADRLKKLLNTQDGSGNGVSGGSNRQEGWIVITGDQNDETGYYPGTVTYFDAVDEVFVSFASIQANPANEDDKLVKGRRYIGQRSGDNEDGESIWIVAATSEVEGCCGIRKVVSEDDPSGCDPGTLVIDGENLFGEGLSWDQEACQVKIKKGCGITFEGGDTIGVHAGDLAGPGLIATTGCKLEVNAGDCLEVDDDGKLNVKIEGTFSAVTSVYFEGGCLVTNTTPFSFEGCSLVAGEAFTSKSPIPCTGCQPCASSSSSMSSSSSPYLSSSSSTDCGDCDFSVIINGETYQFEAFGGSGYIATFGEYHLYMTPPTTCSAFWLVQLYDGALEICNWESYWIGTGCGVLEQGTNNGIEFTQCPADSVTLCCDGSSESSSMSIYPSDSSSGTPESCPGECAWTWTSGAWVFGGNGCIGGGTCYEPNRPGDYEGEYALFGCYGCEGSSSGCVGACFCLGEPEFGVIPSAQPDCTCKCYCPDGVTEVIYSGGVPVNCGGTSPSGPSPGSSTVDTSHLPSSQTPQSSTVPT